MKTVELSDIAEVKLGRQRSPQHHSGDSMRPYLRAANVGWSGLRLDDVKEMNFTDVEMETFRLQRGDVLLNEASGSAKEVGKPALWSGELRTALSRTRFSEYGRAQSATVAICCTTSSGRPQAAHSLGVREA